MDSTVTSGGPPVTPPVSALAGAAPQVPRPSSPAEPPDAGPVGAGAGGVNRWGGPSATAPRVSLALPCCRCRLCCRCRAHARVPPLPVRRAARVASAPPCRPCSRRRCRALGRPFGLCPVPPPTSGCRCRVPPVAPGLPALPAPPPLTPSDMPRPPAIERASEPRHHAAVARSLGRSAGRRGGGRRPWAARGCGGRAAGSGIARAYRSRGPGRIAGRVREHQLVAGGGAEAGRNQRRWAEIRGVGGRSRVAEPDRGRA